MKENRIKKIFLIVACFLLFLVEQSCGHELEIDKATEEGTGEFPEVWDQQISEHGTTWEDKGLFLCSVLNAIGVAFFVVPLHAPGKRKLIKGLGHKDSALGLWLWRLLNAQIPFLVLCLASNGGSHQLADEHSSPPEGGSSARQQQNYDQQWASASEMMAVQRRYLLTVANIGFLLVLRRLLGLTRANTDKVLELEEAALERDVVAFRPPPLALCTAKIALVNKLFDPQVAGLEHLPSSGPCLLVGNHAVLGLDMPSLIYAIYRDKGVYVRGLADHLHFALPGWGEFLSFFGAVDGTPRHCSALLSSQQFVLVYPGGAQEVMTNDYELKWKNRLGFVRQACQHNSPIVPIATVGTNEMLDVVHKLPIGWLLGYQDLEVPILKPNLSIQRIYYKFGAPIDPADFFPNRQIDLANQEALVAIRDRVKLDLETLINELRSLQSSDPHRYLSERIQS